MRFNLAVIQSFLAPALTPVPAALLLASKVYSVLLSNVGWLAWIGAVASFLGLESLGGLTCYAAIKAYRRRDWGSFLVAAALVIVYIAAGVSSVLWLEHSDAQILAWGFGLTVAAYIAYAMVQDVWDSERETSQEINLLRAKTNLANAEARKAKAELLQIPGGVQLGVQPSSGQSGQASSVRADIAALLDNDPTLSARAIARRLDISPTTASEHKKLWQLANTVAPDQS